MNQSIFPIEIIIKITKYITFQDNSYICIFRSLCKYTYINSELRKLYNHAHWKYLYRKYIS